MINLGFLESFLSLKRIADVFYGFQDLELRFEVKFERFCKCNTYSSPRPAWAITSNLIPENLNQVWASWATYAWHLLVHSFSSTLKDSKNGRVLLKWSGSWNDLVLFSSDFYIFKLLPVRYENHGSENRETRSSSCPSDRRESPQERKHFLDSLSRNSKF